MLNTKKTWGSFCRGKTGSGCSKMNVFPQMLRGYALPQNALLYCGCGCEPHTTHGAGWGLLIILICTHMTFQLLFI